MGILAIAGAAAGAGQGAVEAGREGQKLAFAEKVNQLSQAREEAIERLRAEHQSEMQQSEQTFQKGQTETKIGAASKAAAATRTFEHKENVAKRASEEKRTGITAKSRVDAALVRASATEAGKGGGGKIWEFHNVTHSGLDPTTKMPMNNQTMVAVNNHNGNSYMQIGDKMIRYNSQTNAPAFDPKQLRRAKAEDLQDLLTDPLGTVPDGPNKGLTKADVFEQANGYLPTAWTTAAMRADQQARQTTTNRSLSLPSGLLQAAGGPNATSTKIGSAGGSEEADDGSENAAQSDEDSSSNSPGFQSNAMSDYSAHMQ